jgi:glycosyltransferase involved in cell wall biosynthesis
LFGDPTGAADWDQFFHISMHLPIALGAVSSIVEEILRVHFGRKAPVIPNAIDTKIFTPNKEQRFPDPSRKEKRVLIVGNPALRLKNFQVALEALNHVYDQFPNLHVTWICQVQPQVSGTRFPISFVVNPAQEKLPELYRDHHDAFLFASVYEAWGMPVMEAMASGIPVVTSKCHGVDMFCTHEENCLMAKPKDALGLGRCVIRILKDTELANKFSKAGRKTALAFTWDNTMEKLEKALYTVCCGVGSLWQPLCFDLGSVWNSPD